MIVLLISSTQTYTSTWWTWFSDEDDTIIYYILAVANLNFRERNPDMIVFGYVLVSPLRGCYKFDSVRALRRLVFQFGHLGRHCLYRLIVSWSTVNSESSRVWNACPSNSDNITAYQTHNITMTWLIRYKNRWTRYMTIEIWDWIYQHSMHVHTE